jgi:hypothetical protein
MATKAEKLEALETLKLAVKGCRPNGRDSVLIDWVGGGATPSGRTDYYNIRVLQAEKGHRDEKRRARTTYWLVRTFCVLSGHRLNRKREAVSMGGCGFNKAHDIAATIARLAGHPVEVCGDYTGRVGS